MTNPTYPQDTIGPPVYNRYSLQVNPAPDKRICKAQDMKNGQLAKRDLHIVMRIGEFIIDLSNPIALFSISKVEDVELLPEGSSVTLFN